MFAAGALPEAVAADDDRLASGIADGGGAFGEGGLAGDVGLREDRLGVFGDVAAVFEVSARGHDVVGGGLVAGLDDHDAVELLRQRLAVRRRADRGLADDLDGRRIVGGRQDHGVVDREGLRVLEFRVVEAERERGGEFAGKRGGAGGLRADQVGLVALRAGASGEVAVERADRDGAVCGALALSDAGAAAAFEDAGSGGDDVGELAVGGEHGEDLAAAGGDVEGDVRVDLASPEHPGDDGEVAVGAVRAGADDDLVDLHAGELGDGPDVVRAGRARRHGLERGEVDVDDAVVFGVGVGDEFGPDGAASLRLEEGAGAGVGREDGGGHAQLGAHVGDGGALGDGEGGDAGAEILDHAADVALRREDAEDLQDDVLRGDPGLELPGEADADDLRIGEAERLARHGERDVQPARADRHHADAAAGRGVGVGAEQGLAGHAEAFEVDLVADAVAGAAEADAVRGGDGLEIEVVIGVFRAHLEHVVVDVGHGQLGFHLAGPHRLEFQIRHRPRGVLRQRLVDADRRGFAGHAAAGHEMVR